MVHKGSKKRKSKDIWYRVPAKRIYFADGTVLHLQCQEIDGERWYHFREDVSDVSFTDDPETDTVSVTFRIK